MYVLALPRLPKITATCYLAVLIALYVVGAVSLPPGSLRHEIQTLPLWFPIVLGFQQRPIAKWMALPLFMLWLAIMLLIWLYLLGVANIVSGHFFPTEIAMTLIVGLATGEYCPLANFGAPGDGDTNFSGLRRSPSRGLPH